MFKIVICDDESAVRAQLRQFLERFAAECGKRFEVLEYASADALLQNYPSGADLLLLDIYMGGVDGLAAARQIRTFDEQVCMIFITTMYQCAIEGYKVRAFGFIKKPVSWTELRGELTCALRQAERSRANGLFLSVRSGGAVHRVPMDEILSCEVRNHTILVRTDAGVTEFRGQMRELEEQLLAHGFFRCHASFLVNGKRISRIEPMRLLLTDGSAVPVSQHRRREFMAALSTYVGQQI